VFEKVGRIREIRGFNSCKSFHRLEIPDSAEIVDAFHGCDSLTEVIFEGDSRIREIKAIDECKSLAEIAIPGSVKILLRFNFWSKLAKITFPPTCRFRIIEELWRSVIRSVEIPASVESIIGFENRSLSLLSFAEGTIIKRIQVGSCCSSVSRYWHPVFVVYGEDDQRKIRYRLNLV
jgi:hypothetical protein